MKILSATPQTVIRNGEVTNMLTVTVEGAYSSEILNLGNEPVTAEGVTYVGYSELKSYKHNVGENIYEAVLIKPTDLEQKVRQMAEIVLIEPEKMSLSEYKAWAVEKTKTLIDEKLKSGIEHLGKIYNACKEKQDLLANQLGLYALNLQFKPDMEDKLFWNTKDGVCEECSFEYLVGLANVMKAAALPLQKKQQSAEIEIKAAITREEIEAILRDFE